MFGVCQGLRMFPSLVNCWGLRNVSRLDEDSSQQLFWMHFWFGSESCTEFRTSGITGSSVARIDPASWSSKNFFMVTLGGLTQSSGSGAPDKSPAYQSGLEFDNVWTRVVWLFPRVVSFKHALHYRSTINIYKQSERSSKLVLLCFVRRLLQWICSDELLALHASSSQIAIPSLQLQAAVWVGCQKHWLLPNEADRPDLKNSWASRVSPRS